MTDRLCVDTNAVADLLRETRIDPPPIRAATDIFLPLPVAGELYAGAYSSRRLDHNLGKVETLVAKWTTLTPDLETARIYGRLRGEVRSQLSTSRMNDLWIAALCIQHDLPLLTNDSGFTAVPGLTVINW
jgi:tRNA(fMet)-specific endonuclease VapC